MSDFLDDLKKLLQPIQRQIGGMVSRVVVRAVNDAPGRQELQVEGFDEELHPTVEHMQPFGVRGFPPSDVDGIGFAVGGYRNHLVVMGVAPKVAGMPELKPGDVLFYCLNPNTWTLAGNDGNWRASAAEGWHAALFGLETKQFVTMVPGTTTIRVEDPGTGKYSLITITPASVTINSQVFQGLG
jgi:hypothetical protein